MNHSDLKEAASGDIGEAANRHVAAGQNILTPEPEIQVAKNDCNKRGFYGTTFASDSRNF